MFKFCSTAYKFDFFLSKKKSKIFNLHTHQQFSLMIIWCVNFMYMLPSYNISLFLKNINFNWNVAPLWMKKKNSHIFVWSISPAHCKQLPCSDEILSLHYLNLNARSFVKWFGLRSPNRNKFSRVAKHNRKNQFTLVLHWEAWDVFFLFARWHTFWLVHRFFPPLCLET